MTNDEFYPEKLSRWRRPRARWLAVAALVLATVLAYSNSFNGPFVLDDLESIVENRSLLSAATVWSPPTAAGVGGRPLLNLSFAANHALGKLDPAGYHVVNLAIHLGAALVVFGLVRRTLARPPLGEYFVEHALPVALVTALLWTLHPLQTESVTYVSQRAESLMGLCLLLTLYGFVRSLDSPLPKLWLAGSAIVAAAGMGVKETMVVAPLSVLAYDRVFVSAGWRAAVVGRWRYYAALAAGWGWLGWLMAGSELGRRGVGFEQDVSIFRYWLIECGAVVHYLRLAIWPAGLLIDYGQAENVGRFAGAFGVVGVAALAVAVIFAGRRWPAVGFAGGWFFVMLAPTSSLVPISGQPVAEHRMYLALLAPIAVVVTAAYRWRGLRALVVLAVVAVAAGGATWLRNRDYATADALWADAIAKDPKNARAWDNLGVVRLGQSRLDEAQHDFETGLRLEPRSGLLHLHLGVVFSRKGNTDQAGASFAKAVELMPGNPIARNYLAVALVARGRFDEALRQLGEAIRANPENAALHANLCGVLRGLGRFDDAIRHGQEAVRLAPWYHGAHGNLAMALLAAGRVEDAVVHHRDWLRLQPGYTGSNHEFAVGLLRLRRLPEAKAELEDMVSRNPGDSETHNLLGIVLVELGERERARSVFERALQLKPDSASATDNLQRLRAMPADAPPAGLRKNP